MITGADTLRISVHRSRLVRGLWLVSVLATYSSKISVIEGELLKGDVARCRDT